MNTPLSVLVASADPVTSAALTELLREGGMACADSAASATIILSDADAPVALEQGTLAVLSLSKNPDAAQQPVLAKPVRRTELLGRLAQMAEAAALPEALKLGEQWVLHPAERTLKRRDEQAAVLLTEKEVRLLACLLTQPQRVASRQKLLGDVWGYGSDIHTHTLETHIHRLRAKLKDIDGEGWISASDDGYRISA